MAGPILERFKANHPFIGGAIDFFGNYARKATVVGGLGGAGGAALLTTLVNSLPEGTLEGILATIAEWPTWLQAVTFLIVVFAALFLVAYFPRNIPKSET